jgi:hypothetical protein
MIGRATKKVYIYKQTSILMTFLFTLLFIVLIHSFKATTQILLPTFVHHDHDYFAC